MQTHDLAPDSNCSDDKGSNLPSGSKTSILPDQTGARVNAGHSTRGATPDASTEEKPWLKMLEHYKAYSQKPEQRGRGLRSIGEILWEMFGPIDGTDSPHQEERQACTQSDKSQTSASHDQ